MGTFQLYFKLGLEHITDFNGFDHILFIVSMCVLYSFKQIKTVLIIATAFTIGHSITLVLAYFNVFTISSLWIEFLIPITIFITALQNLFLHKREFIFDGFKYFMTLFFGLIHGLGFSVFLKALSPSKEKFISSLLAFNLGVEIGQIIIIVGVLILNLIIKNYFHKQVVQWQYAILVITASAALWLMFVRFPLV